MSKMRDAFEFRSCTKPFTTLWSVGDTQAFGNLVWLNGSPVLTLFLEVDEAVGPDFDKVKVPALELTKPQTSSFG
jgi:hypothetical protein